MRRRRKTTYSLVLAALLLASSGAGIARAGAPCPSGGAQLRFRINNQSGNNATIRVKGTRLTGTCDQSGLGLDTSYDLTATCQPGVTTTCVAKSNMASGIYHHEIIVSVPSQSPFANQRQFYTNLVVADPSSPSEVAWTVFHTVRTVKTTADPTSGSCTASSCSFRQAVAAAAGGSESAPVLVQFDPTVFPPATVSGGTTITLNANAIEIKGDGTVIDGRDSKGEPSIFFPQPGAYSRRLLFHANGGALIFKGVGQQVAGLELVRNPGGSGSNSGDVVIFSGGGNHSSQLVNSRVDGGGGALPAPTPGLDSISAIGSSGGNFATANRVTRTEITRAKDKGVKVNGSNTFLVVEDSWIHHNNDGGLQATLDGNLRAENNLVESSGYNASDAQVSASANGIAIQGGGGAPDLFSTGNVIRRQTLRGISVANGGAAEVTRDYVCGSTNTGVGGQNGMAVLNTAHGSAYAKLRGSAFVYSGRNGVTVIHSSFLDAGQSDGDRGGNAFTMNATVSGLGGRNFHSGTGESMPTVRNQWQRCGIGATCNDTAIRANDISGPVTFTATVPQRNPPSPPGTSDPGMAIQGFSPTRVALQNDLVRIIGRGFNAIDGHPQDGNCTTTVPANNTCSSPVKGVCVEFEFTPNTWTAAEVQAVTPEQIVVKYPSALGCASPVWVRVRQLKPGNTTETHDAIAQFCTN